MGRVKSVLFMILKDSSICHNLLYADNTSQSHLIQSYCIAWYFKVLMIGFGDFSIKKRESGNLVI